MSKYESFDGPSLPRLLALDDAADQIGVPRAAFRQAAEQHGFIIKIGRKPLINSADIERLIRKCQARKRSPPPQICPPSSLVHQGHGQSRHLNGPHKPQRS